MILVRTDHPCLRVGRHSYYDQPVAATIDRWMSHESIATQGHNSDKRSVISLGLVATKGHITLLQNKPLMTVPLFKQCRAKKIHDTALSGCPSSKRLDTSNHKPVSGTNEVHGQSDTDGWHQTPMSVGVEIIIN
jgi:hypothetical protein